MTAMTPRRLDWALRTRGPQLDAWPEAERDAALELLRHDAAARLALADAIALEDDAPTIDPKAEQQSLCRMQRAVRRALAPCPMVLRGFGLGAMAACLAAGLYLGVAAAEYDSVGPLGPAAASNLPATVLAALDP